mmetsp:Transcript_77405/g.244574  ORF Transcript_77405/g.244574 Transcript_77405/m.244574 type:complete len:213 (-) Transcript_77405:54-692(-)
MPCPRTCSSRRTSRPTATTARPSASGTSATSPPLTSVPFTPVPRGPSLHSIWSAIYLAPRCLLPMLRMCASALRQVELARKVRAGLLPGGPSSTSGCTPPGSTRAPSTTPGASWGSPPSQATRGRSTASRRPRTRRARSPTTSRTSWARSSPWPGARTAPPSRPRSATSFRSSCGAAWQPGRRAGPLRLPGRLSSRSPLSWRRPRPRRPRGR